MDEANLRPGKRAKKLRTCMQVKKVPTKVDSFGGNKGTSDVSQGESDDGLNPQSQGWRKYDIALMAFVNSVCKTMKGMIVILYKLSLFPL